jgi:hypothetical protein
VNEWGIPDWNDERAYGETKHWSEFRWRWEFTRRRQDCRDDFLAHKDETVRFFDEVRALEVARSPEAKRSRLRRPDEPGFTAQVPDCYEKYGLTSLPNPAIGDQPFFVIMFRKRNHCLVMSPKDRINKHFAATDVVVIFDLAAPIGEQLAGIRKTLEWEQEEKIGRLVRSGKKHPTKWLSYLRVLDAKASGASLSQIAKTVLNPGRRADHAQLARDKLKQAEALCFKWPS